MRTPSVKKTKIGEKTFRLYSIGWLSLKCGKARITLRKWNLAGILPNPIMEIEGREDYRYYLASEIELYTQVIKTIKQGRGVRLEDQRIRQRLMEVREGVVDMLKNNPESLPSELAFEKKYREALEDTKKWAAKIAS